MKLSTYTSTLPDDLLQELSEKAKKLSIPKNKLIENALQIHLDHLNKAEYKKSYKIASEDLDITSLAEEGINDYLILMDNDAR